MPTYQYACTACGEQLEVVQSFTDAALTECPACTGALRKVFSAVGVVFKGSGFYKTDSRAKTSAGSDKGDSTSDTKSDGKADKKSDPAPAGTGGTAKGDSSSSSAGSSTGTGGSSSSGGSSGGKASTPAA